MGHAQATCIITFLCVSVGLCASASAWAYIPTVTSGGRAVTWRGPLKFNLSGNPRNQSGLDASRFGAAVVRGLQRWQFASGATLGFDYWQGTDPSIYLPNSEYNGLSSIYFASNSTADSHLSPNVLGLTQVWYDTTNGQILETDIVLNDKNFRFTTDPQDTSGYGSSGPSASEGGLNKVFVENVLTHELGHAFGLSHSGGLQSTMLFMESPEQAHLGCDEQTAIHALYPSADATSRGAIAGRVVSGPGEPVFGAHVVAISRRRGTVLATGLTDPSGRYEIQALEPGIYFLMAEPYFAGTSALPGYYAGIKSSACSGQGFSRGFMLGAGGAIAAPVPVNRGSVTLVQDFMVKCDAAHGHAARFSSSTSASVAEIYSGLGTGFGYVAQLDSMGPVRYRLREISGHLELHAASYSLYSPVRANIELLDPAGRNVELVRGTPVGSEPVYRGDSGYINFDSELVADGLELGDYTVVVQPAAVDPVHYPAGSLALDPNAFLLLTGSLNEAPSALASTLPVNARCLMDERFPSYSSPPGNPPRASLDGGGAGGSGFCGTLASFKRDRADRSAPNTGAKAGWLLPWLLMLAFARWAKVRASRSELAPRASSG